MMEQQAEPGINTNMMNLPLSEQAVYEKLANCGAGLTLLIRESDQLILHMNEQFTYFFGYTSSDIAKGIYFTNLIEPHQYVRFTYHINTVKNSLQARSQYLTYRLISKTGDIISCNLYASPLNLGDNQAQNAFHLVFHPDLSKWTPPFTSFETKELFLEQFTNESFGTFEYIRDVDRVFWSAGVYSIYEVDDVNREIDYQFVNSFAHPDDKLKISNHTKSVLEQGSDMDVVFRIVTAKNNVKLIHGLGKVIKDSEGKLLKFAGSIRDITEQRQIEEALKNKVEELFRSNRELEEFAYIASHDLQEPLRKITTFSDRLAEKYKDVLTSEGEMYLQRIVASAGNMRSLINDLLEFSRISKTESQFQTIGLNDVLKSVLHDFEVPIDESKAIVNIDTLPEIMAIPSQMKQLFGNIISNAIKFRKPGVQPLIDVTSSRLTTEEKNDYGLQPHYTYYRIQITDNGIGFENEYALRIFQVFQRLHGRSEYPGTGIGLAICKKIVECHNGQICAKNVDGKGARFIIILPQEHVVVK